MSSGSPQNQGQIRPPAPRVGDQTRMDTGRQLGFAGVSGGHRQNDGAGHPGRGPHPRLHAVHADSEKYGEGGPDSMGAGRGRDRQPGEIVSGGPAPKGVAALEPKSATPPQNEAFAVSAARRGWLACQSLRLKLRPGRRPRAGRSHRGCQSKSRLPATR